MKVAITGASGMIGTALREILDEAGHDVVRLVRRAPTAPDEVGWDPGRGAADLAGLAGVEGIVNLAGANLGARRWTTSYQQVIRASRVDATSTIARTAATLDPLPRVLVSASATGIYGPDRGDEVLDESAALGAGFLPDVCRAWEAATAPAADVGVRVVHLRSGLVMSRRGGALRRMLPLFRAGVGGRLGGGRQWWSHVSLQDEVRAIRFLLESAHCAGSYNITAPHPATNAQFSAELATAVHRPAVLPVPSLALRVALGDFAQDILGSLRVVPARLGEAGFTHLHPDAPAVVRAALD